MENLPDDVLGSLLRRPDVTDLDVDHFSVNLNVNEGLGAILHNVCGISVSLATSTTRFYDRAFYGSFQSMYIVGNPAIVETAQTPTVKKDICEALNTLGCPVQPNMGVGLHMCRGKTKNISPYMLCRALIDAGIRYVRVVSFGTKLPVSEFPNLEAELRLCDDELNGYPTNMWDIGVIKRVDHIMVLRVEHRYRLQGVTIENYVFETPLDDRAAPTVNHGGGVSLIVEGDLCQVKYYQILYHFLRCSHSYELNVPSSGHVAYRRLGQINEVIDLMAENRALLGGVRTEVRILSKTISEAVALFMQQKPWMFPDFVIPATVSIRSVHVDDYVRKTYILLDVAKSRLAQFGLTASITSLSEEMKKIFGDLKSLLSYTTHKIPRTDPIDPRAWWRSITSPVTLALPIPPNPDSRPCPPPTALNTEILQLAEVNRRRGGNRSIRWQSVLEDLKARHPELTCKYEIDITHLQDTSRN